MAYPKEKPPSPPIVMDRLLRTLCGFVSCPFLRKSFATTLEGRLNFYSPSRRPRSTRPGSGTVPYRYMGAEPGPTSAGRTSQNSVERKSNFGVGRLAEVQLPKALRRHDLRTPS